MIDPPLGWSDYKMPPVYISNGITYKHIFCFDTNTHPFPHTFLTRNNLIFFESFLRPPSRASASAATRATAPPPPPPSSGRPRSRSGPRWGRPPCASPSPPPPPEMLIMKTKRRTASGRCSSSRATGRYTASSPGRAGGRTRRPGRVANFMAIFGGALGEFFFIGAPFFSIKSRELRFFYQFFRFFTSHSVIAILLIIEILRLRAFIPHKIDILRCFFFLQGFRPSGHAPFLARQLLVRLLLRPAVPAPGDRQVIFLKKSLKKHCDFVGNLFVAVHLFWSPPPPQGLCTTASRWPEISNWGSTARLRAR